MNIVWIIPREQVDEKKPVTLILYTLKRLHVWSEIQNTTIEAALERIKDYCKPSDWTGEYFPAEIFGWVGGSFQTVARVN